MGRRGLFIGRSVSKLFGAVAACLFFAQLFMAAFAYGGTASPDGSFTKVICELTQHPKGTGSVPAGHNDHCTACSICTRCCASEANYSVPPIIITVQFPRIHITHHGFVDILIAQGRMGWASSWSARAPPSFS